MLSKIVRASAREPSFNDAAEALADLAEVKISGRHVTRIAEEVGHQLAEARDHAVHEVVANRLDPEVDTRPALAVVGVDGGRLQIRDEGDGPGAHNGSWCEDKVAVLATATRVSFDADPEPDLPECFRDRSYVEKLTREIAGQSTLGEPETQADSPDVAPAAAEPSQRKSVKGPELLVRTYVASTCASEQFGTMVVAEATKRNFANATLRAFVGDGATWIWKLHQLHFPTFQAIVDFLHVLGHLFAAAKAAEAGTEERWTRFQRWAEACWRGQVSQVITELHALVENLTPLGSEDAAPSADDDPREILLQQLGYLERNQERMDYPTYRKTGLPWTSSHVESTVKLFNRRVKGSEKFWGEAGAEAILQLRAAFLSEDDRLERHLDTQPSSPFRTYKGRKTTEAA